MGFPGVSHEYFKVFEYRTDIPWTFKWYLISLQKYPLIILGISYEYFNYMQWISKKYFQNIAEIFYKRPNDILWIFRRYSINIHFIYCKYLKDISMTIAEVSCKERNNILWICKWCPTNIVEMLYKCSNDNLWTSYKYPMIIQGISYEYFNNIPCIF